MAWESTVQVPQIDFSGLDLNQPGGPRWEAVRGRVMDALAEHTCFAVVRDEFHPELNETLFGRAVKEVFALPEEVKYRNAPGLPARGYARPVPGLAYESLAVEGAQLLEGARRFTNLMWPDGNPEFCDTVRLFAKQLMELEQMVVRMILESLGTEKYYDSHVQSTKYMFRLNAYAPQSTLTTVGLPDHTDHNMITIICQDNVPGLQLQAKDGDWKYIMPMPNSFIVLVGDSFEAWSNGRLRPTPHRVMISGDETRYSALQASYPKEGILVKAPEELVDEEHPMLFKPYYHSDFLHFCFSERGGRSRYRLRTFCGVQGLGVEV